MRVVWVEGGWTGVGGGGRGRGAKKVLVTALLLSTPRIIVQCRQDHQGRSMTGRVAG